MKLEGHNLSLYNIVLPIDIDLDIDIVYGITQGAATCDMRYNGDQIAFTDSTAAYLYQYIGLIKII